MASRTAFDIPADQRALEDYREGDVFVLGPAVLTEEAILAFATAFDPQAFHVDPEGAKAGPFGGLIASGWHTIGVVMRLLVDHFLPGPAALGSPGLDAVSWPAPVRPGDTLTARVTILSARRSQSRPEKGIVTIGVEANNQDGITVLRLDTIKLMMAARTP